MNSNWKKKMNAIPKQLKGPNDRITAREWNQIINILSEQANNNTLGNEKFIKFVEEIESGNLKKEIVFKIFKNYEGDLSKFLEELILRMELTTYIKRYETEDDFPEVGNEETLYISKFYKFLDGEGNTVLKKLNSIFGFDPESGYYAIGGQNGGTTVQPFEVYHGETAPDPNEYNTWFKPIEEGEALIISDDLNVGPIDTEYVEPSNEPEENTTELTVEGVSPYEKTYEL